MNWAKVATLVIQYAPAAIDLAERVFSKGENDRKRLTAAKEVTEAVREVVKNIDQFPHFEADSQALAAAVKDEARFGEEVAKVNDAIVAFQNFVDSYKAE